MGEQFYWYNFRTRRVWKLGRVARTKRLPRHVSGDGEILSSSGLEPRKFLESAAALPWDGSGVACGIGLCGI